MIQIDSGPFIFILVSGNEYSNKTVKVQTFTLSKLYNTLWLIKSHEFHELTCTVTYKGHFGPEVMLDTCILPFTVSAMY